MAFVLLVTFAMLPGMCKAQQPEPIPPEPSPYYKFNYGFKDLSPDGKNVLTSEGMWNLEDKRWVWQTWFSPEYKRDSDELPVRFAVFMPDGKNIVAWRQSYWTQHLSAEELRTGKEPKRNKIWVVDAATGRTVRSLDTDFMFCACMVMSPDGKELFLGGGGLIGVWNLTKGEKSGEIETTIDVYHMAISPDGKHLICGGQNTPGARCDVQMWEVATRKELWRAEGESIDSIAPFSPDGKHVMSPRCYSAFLQVRDSQTGKLVQSLQIGKDKDNTVHRARFDKTGKHVLTLAGAGETELWNLESRSVVAKLKFFPQLPLPDGKRFLTAAPGSMLISVFRTGDGELIEQWELGDAKPIRRGHPCLKKGTGTFITPRSRLFCANGLTDTVSIENMPVPFSGMDAPPFTGMDAFNSSSKEQNR